MALLRRRGTTSDSGGTPLLPPIASGAGLLSCQVLDPIGHPMGSADITVSDMATGRTRVKGTSDPYGTFLTTLPPGNYTVTISADSLHPYRGTVEIAEGLQSPIGQVQLAPSPQAELPPPGTWLFDPPHTAIRFIAKHVGMANVHGRFERFEGSIRIADRMEDSQVEVHIEAASIATCNKTRDNHLRSDDFLDVDRYPYVHFASDRFVHRGGSKWTLQGHLTMHGISRSVGLETTYLGLTTGGYGEELRCAALAKAELHREDYTLNWRKMLARGIAVVGPTIQLELDIQAMFASHDTPTPPE
ncbi:YceI family protein [Actinacidiphila soli]|uniref:YceI family protein n=1 Tax=Actinacidiphila soli TaxID=2487275 RepID=UPI000FCCBC64|nr:YceI family protein [Actinacidiphila soli]